MTRSVVWPRTAAIVLSLALWQSLTLAGWKPDHVLPGPGPVLARLWSDIVDLDLVRATAVTVRRAAIGYGTAVIIGLAVGIVVARNRVVRTAIGSLITGLHTMPSIAWLPFAIMVFGFGERAILFVVVLGAAPAIANGLISAVDHIPPQLLRASHVLGARGVSAYRHVILPAALPGFVAGLKQGWAFAWRSLMAGELLVMITGEHSLGVSLYVARNSADAEGLIATMLAILLVGIIIDTLVFTRLELGIRKRWGLV